MAAVQSSGVASRASAPQDFGLFFDPALTAPTPYHAKGSYFRDAKDRIDQTFRLIQDEVRGKDVLDVGASPFYLLYQAGAKGARSCHGTYYANDDHPLKDVGTVHSAHGDIHIHHSDIEHDRLPFADDSFDLITACEILEHLENFPANFASEVTRVLRPGGTLLITVPNVCRIANVAKLILQKNIYMKYRPDPTGRHKHEFTQAEVRALFDYMGFDVVRAGFIPYSTSPKRFMRPVNRVVGSVPGLRGYAPVTYVMGRQRTPKAALKGKSFPTSLYTGALSIED